MLINSDASLQPVHLFIFLAIQSLVWFRSFVDYLFLFSPSLSLDYQSALALLRYRIILKNTFQCSTSIIEQISRQIWIRSVGNSEKQKLIVWDRIYGLWHKTVLEERRAFRINLTSYSSHFSLSPRSARNIRRTSMITFSYPSCFIPTDVGLHATSTTTKLLFCPGASRKLRNESYSWRSTIVWSVLGNLAEKSLESTRSLSSDRINQMSICVEILVTCPSNIGFYGTASGDVYFSHASWQCCCRCSMREKIDWFVLAAEKRGKKSQFPLIFRRRNFRVYVSL